VIALLEQEPFEQTVCCHGCLKKITIVVPPEESATEAMLAWVKSAHLCEDCKKKKERS